TEDERRIRTCIRPLIFEMGWLDLAFQKNIGGLSSVQLELLFYKLSVSEQLQTFT
ncbi:hypothetical protein KI387_023026, partial [Taxus chinensis]